MPRVALLLTLIVGADRAVARAHVTCITKKVVIVDAPSGSSSANSEENLGFWIDEAAKTIASVDGTPLTVKLFDDRWISAAYGDVAYEFDRQNGNVTYAGTSMRDGTATIVIGSGRCESTVNPTR